MKKLFLSLVALLVTQVLLAQEIEKITIPQGVVYKYSDAPTYEKAKNLILKELSDSQEYSLTGQPMMFIGPVLWKSFKKIKSLKEIPGGNTTLLVDDQKLEAKLIQTDEDGRKVWDEFRKAISGKAYELRKATPEELTYYWSVISFDIEEPLIILDTGGEKYIINLLPGTLKLLWLDQVP